MQIKILFDKDSLNDSLATGWGVSYLLDDKILFDTGDGSWMLLSNMEIMRVNLEKLKKIVISHDHWDHIGGLGDILDEYSKLKVYGCSSFDDKFKNLVKSHKSKPTGIKSFTKLEKNVYSTGEIKGSYNGQMIWEQSLVVKTPKGITIITGCSHPGIIKIIETVKDNLSEKIFLVIGGFHLKNQNQERIESIVEDFRRLGVEKVAPTHCTGENAFEVFKKEYGDNCMAIKVGQIINI